MKKIFFVEHNPVIVFAESVSNEKNEHIEIFNKIWCMAKPSILFISGPGEISVFNLANAPVNVKDVKAVQDFTALDIARNTLEVATQLKRYSRQQIESGKIFEDEKRFGDTNLKADKTLITDLKVVRERLMSLGLKGQNLRYAHALIGRSIFIRYLEDRGILLENYFRKIALGNRKWNLLLNSAENGFSNSGASKSFYLHILSDKDFAYALYEQLEKDFHGDIFASDNKESDYVTSQHLNELADFLQGNVADQKSLFFWAYRFDIIPIELISNIYEDFYHVETKSVKGKNDKNATHYTSAALVDYILSKILTTDVLEENPRILDPTCGSGIFLVEAFRRIVRYRIAKNSGERLSAAELREILKSQIVGIEINSEAARITVFSLYLAFLHYQEPPDILYQIKHGQRLPKLLFQLTVDTDDFNFNNIFHADCFKIESDSSQVKTETFFPFMEDEQFLPSIGKIDIVIGNPPWGSPEVKDLALDWCKSRKCRIGDKELSQAFILKSLDLVKENGLIGLLVSSGVLLKSQETTKRFRREWFSSSQINEVVNFSHVRDIFFSAGISPFVSVIFKKKQERQKDTYIQESTPHLIRYWSAKKNIQVVNLRTVILHQSDLSYLIQDEVERDFRLWKMLWWGNYEDVKLVRWLEIHPSLSDFSTKNDHARGLQVNRDETRKKLYKWLFSYKLLITRNLKSYGPLEESDFTLPVGNVEHPGLEKLYEGKRLLIKRGITQSTKSDNEKRGRVIVRFEDKPFSFMNSIHSIRLRIGDEEADEDTYKIVLGILWSSLTRYYLFMISSMWGMWHDSLNLAEVLKVPIRLTDDTKLNQHIISLVDELRLWNPEPYSMYNQSAETQENKITELRKLENKLDNAIYKLFELTDREKAQVENLCNFGFDFLYNDYKSEAVTPINKLPIVGEQGYLEDLPKYKSRQNDLESYIETFITAWKSDLEDDEVFHWQVIGLQASNPMLAVLFKVQRKDELNKYLISEDDHEWDDVLRKLDKELLTEYDSESIYIKGLVRVITDNEIIIIKTNEKRLWTRASAYEDAEAIKVKLMNLPILPKKEENFPHEFAY